jgi:hypothetical protein
MMAVIRINKTRDYTVMSNAHFKDKEMTLKAKGLLSLMLSLPDEWDYSVAGLCALSKDGKDSVMNALAELEEFGYLIRTRVTDDKGRFAGYDYDIYENPHTENPCTENPYSGNPHTENPPQLNTNKSSNKESNTKESSIREKRKRFVPPTLDEIKAYCLQRKNNVNPQKFYDYFTASDWYDSKGKKVVSWKQKIITWEAYSTDKKNVGANGIPINNTPSELDDIF